MRKQFWFCLFFFFFPVNQSVGDLKKIMPVGHVQQIDMDDMQRGEEHAKELGMAENTHLHLTVTYFLYSSDFLISASFNSLSRNASEHWHFSVSSFGVFL